MKEIEPVFRSPPGKSHRPRFYHAAWGNGKTVALRGIRDVRFSANQDSPRNPHNPLIRPAGSLEGELPCRYPSDVGANDGEVAILQFEDVGTAIQARRLLAVSVRIRSKPAFEHALLVPIGTYPVNSIFRYGYRVAKSKPEIIGSAVVRLLREKREALGLSMNVVASRAALSHSMVSRVEHELRRPTLDTLLRMAEAMGIDLWPLIRDAEAAQRSSKGK